MLSALVCSVFLPQSPDAADRYHLGSSFAVVLSDSISWFGSPWTLYMTDPLYDISENVQNPLLRGEYAYPVRYQTLNPQLYAPPLSTHATGRFGSWAASAEGAGFFTALPAPGQLDKQQRGYSTQLSLLKEGSGMSPALSISATDLSFRQYGGAAWSNWASVTSKLLATGVLLFPGEEQDMTATITLGTASCQGCGGATFIPFGMGFAYQRGSGRFTVTGAGLMASTSHRARFDLTYANAREFKNGSIGWYSALPVAIGGNRISPGLMLDGYIWAGGAVKGLLEGWYTANGSKSLLLEPGDTVRPSRLGGIAGLSLAVGQLSITPYFQASSAFRFVSYTGEAVWYEPLYAPTLKVKLGHTTHIWLEYEYWIEEGFQEQVIAGGLEASL